MKGVRIISKVDNNKDFRTSTVLDRDILELINQSMNENGYGQRQRSKWINEAIIQLENGIEVCEEDERFETLSRASTLSDNGGHITVVLKSASVAFIERCKAFMSGRESNFESNAQSRLIHFAITFRLIQERYL